jgi:organic radical activating enzyme
VINKQPIEKREPSYDGTLQIHSIFKTIQGEGPFCGTPCVFVRLAGCNLQCPSCDTDYTSKRELMTPSDIVRAVANLSIGGLRGDSLVVITGGEPFRQHVGELIDLLVGCRYYVQVESNGTMNPPIGPWNKNTFERQGAYLVVSPKTGKLNPLAMDTACALKYVVAWDNIRPDDGLPMTALGHSANPYPARPNELFEGLVYVQPQDDKNEAMNFRNTQAAVEACLEHGHILQLQVHKYIGVE